MITKKLISKNPGVSPHTKVCGLFGFLDVQDSPHTSVCGLSRILALENLQGEIDAMEICGEIENKGYKITYETTVSRNLKAMHKERGLDRKAKGEDINQNTGRRHWNYYYKRKK